jgi:hypothetical protein
MYSWETPEAIAKREKNKARTLNASAVYGLEASYPFEITNHCVWCRKEFIKPRKGKRFCSKQVGQSMSDCYQHFWNWWLTIPRFKRVIFVRDNFTCQACRVKPTWINEHGVILPDLNKLAVDHIYPFAKGGKTEISNLQCLCRKCNSRKRDKLEFIPQPALVD